MPIMMDESKNLNEAAVESVGPAVEYEATVPGMPTDYAGIKALHDRHVRLRSLVKDIIADTPPSDEDYWIGMGIDEVPVRAESPEEVMAVIVAAGAADGTVALEFVSSDPDEIIIPTIF